VSTARIDPAVGIGAPAQQGEQAAPQAPPRPCRAPRPWVPGMVLLTGDLVAFAACALAADSLRELLFRSAAHSGVLWAGAVVWIALRAHEQLYPGYGLAGPEELRRSTVTTLVAALGHAALLFATKDDDSSRFISAGSWALLVGANWALRGTLKRLLIKLDLYGCPVVVAGAGKTGAQAVRELNSNRALGFVPVAVFDDDPAKHGRTLDGVPVLGALADALTIAFPYPVRHAIVALPRASDRLLVQTALRYAARFPNLAVVPDLFGLGNLWVRHRPLGGLLTLEIQNNLLHRPSRLAKRALDLVLIVPLCALSLPVILLAGLAVKLFSAGPMLFRQRREGIDGKPIGVWKIRTMVPDAEARLTEYLARDGTAQTQWDQRMKLVRDPRLVPYVGAFLRRFSVDELPQFWNVLQGEMSLVGPRPFPGYHLERFSEQFRVLRRQVPAGITGLWQVTDRSEGDLEVQETADSYYIRNWSLWLDLWILLRTIHVVLSGRGAY
jgi:Undecaprenyl-phosphate galactose phosphotransferase WbaP